jgi:integrase
MAVYKRKRGGKTAWFYKFDAPGSTREGRRIIREFGFASKREAEDAEATRRIDEQNKIELAKVGYVDAPVPKTLESLLDEFFRQHADEKLAPYTVQRYRQQAKYIAPALLAMPIGDITPLHLNREWNRLLKSGGHHRRTKEARPLNPKTVRSIAGVVSSAYSRAMKWGLVKVNPVSSSEPPIPRKRRGLALTPEQQALLTNTDTGLWCLSMFLKLAAATGARRGELLALRWKDIVDGRAVIARSLTQTSAGVSFKEPKTEDSIRTVTLPVSVLESLEAHRKTQDEFRRQFGADYRADLDLIFTRLEGTPLNPNSITASVCKLCSKLKLPKGASLHTLRHSHGSHLLAAGMDLPVISERLGHSSVRITAEVYSHALRGRDDEAARRWEEFQQKHQINLAGRPVS